MAFQAPFDTAKTLSAAPTAGTPRAGHSRSWKRLGGSPRAVLHRCHPGLVASRAAGPCPLSQAGSSRRAAGQERAALAGRGDTSCLPPRCLQPAQRCREEEEGRSWVRTEEHVVAAQNRNALTAARVAPALGDPWGLCLHQQPQAGPSHRGGPSVPGSSPHVQRQKIRGGTGPRGPLRLSPWGGAWPGSEILGRLVLDGFRYLQALSAGLVPDALCWRVFPWWFRSVQLSCGHTLPRAPPGRRALLKHQASSVVRVSCSAPHQHLPSRRRKQTRRRLSLVLSSEGSFSSSCHHYAVWQKGRGLLLSHSFQGISPVGADPTTRKQDAEKQPGNLY